MSKSCQTRSTNTDLEVSLALLEPPVASLGLLWPPVASWGLLWPPGASWGLLWPPGPLLWPSWALLGPPVAALECNPFVLKSCLEFSTFFWTSDGFLGVETKMLSAHNASNASQTSHANNGSHASQASNANNANNASHATYMRMSTTLLIHGTYCERHPFGRWTG